MQNLIEQLLLLNQSHINTNIIDNCLIDMLQEALMSNVSVKPLKPQVSARPHLLLLMYGDDDDEALHQTR